MTPDEIIQHAGAFVLLHGGPPKGLQWRGVGFDKRGSRAREYCVVLDGYLRAQYPGVLDGHPQKAVVWRNRVLREIFSIPQRRASNGTRKQPVAAGAGSSPRAAGTDADE